MNKFVLFILILFNFNAIAQDSIANRLFYNYYESFSKDSSIIYKSVDIVYFGDSLCYEFSIIDTENELYYYYSDSKNIKWNLKRIINHFGNYLIIDSSNKTYQTNKIGEFYNISLGNVNNDDFTSYKYFIEKNKLYCLISETYQWDKFNNKSTHKAKTNEFLFVIDYKELNNKFVKKHIKNEKSN